MDHRLGTMILGRLHIQSRDVPQKSARHLSIYGGGDGKGAFEVELRPLREA